MGRKGANLLALAFCALGVLMCGLSRNMETLIAARFVRLTRLVLITKLNLGSYQELEEAGYLLQHRKCNIYMQS